MIVLPSSVAGQALLRSHVAVRQVYAFDGSGSPLYGGLPLPLVGGQLSLTWTQSVRATATLYLPATPDLVPTTPGAMLGIGKTRLDVYMGTPGQTARVAQLYVNRVTRRRPDGALTLDCGDAFSRLTTCLWDGTAMWVDLSLDGSKVYNSVADVLLAYIRDGLGDATLTLTDPDALATFSLRPWGSSWTLPPGFKNDWGSASNENDGLVFGDVYAQKILDLADWVGGYVHPDADGQWTIAADPQGPATSVLTLATGPGGTVVQVEDGFDRVDVTATRILVKAAATVSGTSDEYATAEVSGDYSPANLGRIDRYVESSNYGSGWANVRAQTVLAREAPGLRRWRIDAVPYPGLEPGDTITLDETATGGPTTDLMVDTVTIPFDLDQTMTLDCRNAPIT